MSEQFVPTVDEAKAASPVTAQDVYLIASRLKRMIVASTAATLAEIANDKVDRDKQLREFQEISRGLEPLLNALVFAEKSDSE